MTSRIPLIIAFLTLFAATPAFAEEVISTSGGAVYMGDVTELTDTAVTIKLASPGKGTRQFQLQDLTDMTLWRLRSKRVQADDGQAMVDLGTWAEARGLLLAAAYEFRRASEVNKVRAEAKPKLVSVLARLAQDLFNRGEKLLVEELPDEALAHFRAVVERYPASDAARAARERVALVESLLRAPQKVAEPAIKKSATPTSAAWERTVKSIQQRLKKAARYEERAAREIRPVRQAGALKKAETQIEAAWAVARKISTSTHGVPPQDALLLKATVRKRLIAAYLRLGLSYLSRRSLNQAQEYCVKVGELDPDHERYDLHDRILVARSTSTWSTSASGRLDRRRGPSR